MLSYVFFIFFSFLSFKKLLYCCVLSTSVRYVFLIFYRRRRKKARENIISSKCVNSKVVWRVFFFSLCFWRQIQIDLFVFVYFCQFLSFFSSPQPSQMIRLFCRFFQDYFSFFPIIPCRILGHFPRFHQSRQRYHYWICFFLVWQRHF